MARAGGLAAALAAHGVCPAATRALPRHPALPEPGPGPGAPPAYLAPVGHPGRPVSPRGLPQHLAAGATRAGPALLLHRPAGLAGRRGGGGSVAAAAPQAHRPQLVAGLRRLFI